MRLFSSTKQESEKDLERRLVEEVKAMGGMAVKLTSQFRRGLPDRLVLLPYHTVAFCEMKSTGEKPTALQDHTMECLRGMGFHTFVIDSTDALDLFLLKMKARLSKCEERTNGQPFVARKQQ